MCTATTSGKSGGAVNVVLEAGCVSVDESDGAPIIGFADCEVHPSQYLMLQRALDPEDDEGVYLERDDQSRSSYGNVYSCTLTRDAIALVLDPRLAVAIDVPPAFAVQFHCADTTFEVLRAGLGRLFAGTNCMLTA